jgi:hypothetical protein
MPCIDVQKSYLQLLLPLLSTENHCQLSHIEHFGVLEFVQHRGKTMLLLLVILLSSFFFLSPFSSDQIEQQKKIPPPVNRVKLCGFGLVYPNPALSAGDKQGKIIIFIAYCYSDSKSSPHHP